ncbi:Nitrogen assimilation transcription factor nit-4 [Beauveria bassiana D1-5]|uniref:Nitrogen assimilation transcription factor nit-4 n=1 Tax=Beauveria bassiana D1-5 TaxID=1245745 RepID=A0A0A2V8R9_BEABA|nr:Nitrogen assimilation transcription factor nit-4 [Beauveria bassiana D1-5]
MTNKRVHHVRGEDAESQGSSSASKNVRRVGTGSLQNITSSRSSASLHVSTTRNPQRRRKLGTITSHACAGCRKKRAKCDGQTPCGRCKLSGAECVYKATVSQSKAQLRKEVYTLRQRQHTLEQLVAAVAQPDPSEHALAYVRSAKYVDSGRPPSSHTAEMFGRGEQTRAKLGMDMPEGCEAASLGTDASLNADEYQCIGSTIGARTHHTAPEPLSQAQGNNRIWDAHTVNWQRRSHKNLQALPFDELRKLSLSETWTCVTDDMELTRHLLALYFCWEYPNFAPISKEHFLQDFHEKRHQYCSPILVNAILALGSSLSDRALTTFRDCDAHGDHFFEEARRLLLSTTDQHSITMIQALVIMSIRESRCSRLFESKHYAEQAMRLAIEMGLHIVPTEECGNELVVLAKTFWGTFALNQAWSFMSGNLPQISHLLCLPPKPAINSDVETSPWVPYVDGDVHLQPPVQLSNVRTVYQCFCELNEAAHQTLYVLYSPGKSPGAADVLHNYCRYLNWYDQLPEGMRLGHNSTPAVLFVHLYYHFAVLLLFRPFLKLRFIGSQIVPREICSQAADAIGTLVSSYAKLYTLRRTPTFLPYFTFASATVHIAISTKYTQISPAKLPDNGSSFISGPDVGEALTLDVAHLTAMAPYHSFAKRALHMLRDHAQKLSLYVDIDRNLMSADDPTKPRDNSLKQAAPDIVADAGVTETSAGHIEFSLPSLFHVHARPILPKALELASLGFTLI